MTPNTSPAANAAAAAQTLAVPLERMTDILAVLRPAQLTAARRSALPAWLGHAIGGLLALVLIAKAFWMRYAPRLRKDPVRDAKLQQLREIGQTKSADDTEFLKSAGSFIERWLGGNPDPGDPSGACRARCRLLPCRETQNRARPKPPRRNPQPAPQGRRRELSVSRHSRPRHSRPAPMSPARRWKPTRPRNMTTR